MLAYLVLALHVVSITIDVAVHRPGNARNVGDLCQIVAPHASIPRAPHQHVVREVSGDLKILSRSATHMHVMITRPSSNRNTCTLRRCLNPKANSKRRQSGNCCRRTWNLEKKPTTQVCSRLTLWDFSSSDTKHLPSNARCSWFQVLPSAMEVRLPTPVIW